MPKFILDDDHAWPLIETQGAEPSTYTFRIWRTLDGGQTWSEGESVAEQHRTWEWYMFFVDNQHGWLVSTDDTYISGQAVTLYFYRTVDGGIHWEELLSTNSNLAISEVPPLKCPGSFLGFRDSSTGWVMCISEHVLLKITWDGGTSWQTQELPKSDNLIHNGCIPYPPTFFSPQEGILQILCRYPSEDLIIYYTHDGGQTWDVPTDRLNLSNSSPIDFVEMNNGWYFARENIKGAAFYVTHDGGKTSSEIIPVITTRDISAYGLPDNKAEMLSSFHFMDQQTGFAETTVGFTHVLDAIHLYSIILKTTDGGYTWNAWVPHLQSTASGH